MRFGAAFWINRTTWPALRDAVLTAERAGWDSVWIDDHLLADEGEPTDPNLEGWATLAALAALTERVRLGLLVAANTFRPPGPTAKLATTLDHLSNGRAVLGIGGGWFAREHEAFGIDFGSSFGDRLDRLDEAVGLIRRLLDGETVTHAAWQPVSDRHGLIGRVGVDGDERGLMCGGSPADVAAFVEPYRAIGISEVIVVLRDPFDLETVERIDEVRSLLTS